MNGASAVGAKKVNAFLYVENDGKRISVFQEGVPAFQAMLERDSQFGQLADVLCKLAGRYVERGLKEETVKGRFAKINELDAEEQGEIVKQSIETVVEVPAIEGHNMVKKTLHTFEISVKDRDGEEDEIIFHIALAVYVKLKEYLDIMKFACMEGKRLCEIEDAGHTRVGNTRIEMMEVGTFESVFAQARGRVAGIVFEDGKGTK